MPKNRNYSIFSKLDKQILLSTKKRYLRKINKNNPRKNYYLIEINRNSQTHKEEKQIILKTKQKLTPIKTKKEFLQTITDQNILRIRKLTLMPQKKLNSTNKLKLQNMHSN